MEMGMEIEMEIGDGDGEVWHTYRQPQSVQHRQRHGLFR